MIEIYETISNIAPPIMNSPFLFRENLHNIPNFRFRQAVEKKKKNIKK